MELDKAKEYLLRRISPGETFEDLLSFPRYLEIETVNACNARCPMCTIADWTRGVETISDELFKKVADEVIQHASEVKRVSLYRDGEPLIDKKLAQRCATLKDGGVKNVTISTNVSLLTPAKSEALLRAGIDIVIMSIDSLNKEIFEGIRVRLKFEEVLENALRFIELRNRIRPETQVWMRMIRQQSNQDEWPSYQDYWSQRMAPNDRIYFHNVFNWGGQLQGYQPIAPSFEPNLPCVALWSLLVIFSNGDVPLCNVDFNKKYGMGSVVTDSIADVWRSKVGNEYRRLHLAGQKGCLSICEHCNVWDESADQDGISSQYAEQVDLGVL